MKDVFMMGGPLFMSILTLLFISMIAWLVYHFVKAKLSQSEKVLRQMTYGKSIGLFALITGILGQLIGFYEAFSVIEHMGDVSPAMVFGGLKVSMITTLYGLFIYLSSLLLWFIFSVMIENKSE